MADDLPREVGRGTIQIGQLEIEVINLDNGQRLITPESMADFLEWLETGDATRRLKNITPKDGR